VYGDEDGGDITGMQSMRGGGGPQDKKALKISYLEAENRNLQ
jgi:hypothetical protein